MAQVVGPQLQEPTFALPQALDMELTLVKAASWTKPLEVNWEITIAAVNPNVRRLQFIQLL